MVFFSYTPDMASLESCNLFNNFSPQEFQHLSQVAKEKKYSTGDQIFKEGDPGDGLYLVKEGLVQISAIVSEGERKVLSQVGPGEAFGEMAVLDSEPRSASAIAEQETTLYFISREDLFRMMEQIPRLSAKFVHSISKRLRDFNRQYIDEVVQSERLALVGRFARSIVHDLKNPLNIIGIAAELAGMESATPASRQTAKTRIRKQIDRISNMVNELLEFTRGSTTAIVLNPSDYAAFIHQLVEEVRPEIEMKSVKIELENEPPSVSVPMNPPRLTRVFHNLLHNAADAMPGGGRVIMRFRVEGKEVITELEDTGAGIAPEIADKLFQAFVTHGKAQGTGLGLSITKKIIEDHRGRIYTRSEPGRGAIFVFHLPQHNA